MTRAKVLSQSGLLRRCASARRAGKKIVFTNGCFDLLHIGHVRYLEQAKKRGDVLVVGVNSDHSVRRLKGRGRPIMPEHERSHMLAALACVDHVTIFNDLSPLALLRRLKPDILVKGADWRASEIVGGDLVKSYGGRVLRLPLVKGRSTTGVIHAIRKTSPYTR